MKIMKHKLAHISDISVTFDVSKLLIFKYSKDSQFLNIPFIVFTFLGKKLLKSIETNDVQE